MAGKLDRALLEAEFLNICRTRGPAWIESVIRPLQFHGESMTVHDIPTHALAAAVNLFGRAPKPAHGS